MTVRGVDHRHRPWPTCSRRPRKERDRGAIDRLCRHFAGRWLSAYKSLAADKRPAGTIRLAFCLAHARRKFVTVYKTTKSPFAQEVIERIAAIYAIEGGSGEPAPRYGLQPARPRASR